MDENKIMILQIFFCMFQLTFEISRNIPISIRYVFRSHTCIDPNPIQEIHS